jgi:hypothetical protein
MARDDTTAAQGGKSGHEKCRGTVDFMEVLRSEHKTINERRDGKRPHIKPKVPRKSDKESGPRQGSCLRHYRARSIGWGNSVCRVLSWCLAST